MHDHRWENFCCSVEKPERCLNVTVGVSTRAKISSWLIRTLLKSPISHAWVAYDDNDFGIRRVMQAEWYGYEDIPYKTFERKNIIVAEFDCKKSLDVGVISAAKLLGSDYDFKSAILLKLKRIIGSIKNLEKFNSPSQLMCSEAVARILQCSNIEFPHNPELTSPLDLLNFFLTDKHFKLIKRSNRLDEYLRRG